MFFTLWHYTTKLKNKTKQSTKTSLSLENITKFLPHDEVFEGHIDKNVRERDHRGGQEGIKHIYHVIFLDVHDGYGICQLLKLSNALWFLFTF